MKFRIKYILLLVFTAVLFGCEDEYDGTGVDSKVSLDDHCLYVYCSDGWNSIDISSYRDNNYYIQINTNGTKTNWKIAGAPDWLKLSSTTGNYSEKVTLQVSPNFTFNTRTATLTVTSTDMPGSFEISVRQERTYLNGSGEGTVNYPFDCEAAYNYIGYLVNNVESESDIYIRGYLNSIKQEYNEKNGCATFSISQDQWNSYNEILVSSALYLGNQKYSSNKRNVLIGDEVVICGKVINKNGTRQTVDNKAYLYSVNGLTNEEIQSISYVLEYGLIGSKYRIKGICTSILNTKYGNYYLIDDTGEIYIYGTVDRSGNNCFETLGISEGDTLTIEGPLDEYNGVPQIKNGVVIDIQKAGNL